MKIDPIISGQLPERVQEAIFNQQNKSEILVGWFQLSIVSLFGILYAVSPKTFSSQSTFTLVPWFLAIYFILTCARILLAQQGRLSAQLLYFSVLADIGLLLSMIWAFHLQYNQPPTFYLKSPTLLYCIMATFGAALPSETYAADALRATEDVLSAVDLLNETLTAHNRPQILIGAAVSTGQIIFGAVGDADRLEYTVIGDAVNLCAKLEKHNKTEGVRALTTENTYTLAFKQGYRFIDENRRLNQRRVEGIDDPINLVVLAY